MVDKINLDRCANVVKMLEVIKIELISVLPTNELRPYYRELDGIKGSLRNRMRLEDPNYGTQEVGQQAAGDSTPSEPSRGGDAPADH